jgi:hypothetical protein
MRLFIFEANEDEPITFADAHPEEIAAVIGANNEVA